MYVQITESFLIALTHRTLAPIPFLIYFTVCCKVINREKHPRSYVVWMHNILEKYNINHFCSQLFAIQRYFLYRILVLPLILSFDSLCAAYIFFFIFLISQSISSFKRSMLIFNIFNFAWKRFFFSYNFQESILSLVLFFVFSSPFVFLCFFCFDMVRHQRNYSSFVL